MTSYPLGFESTLPKKFGLPPLGEPNEAEGIVIKPLKDLLLESKDGLGRVILKRKGERFEELKRTPCKTKKDKGTSETRTPPNSQQFELLRDEMLARITTQRVANVTSKLGRPYPTPSLTQQMEPIPQDNCHPSTESAMTVKEKKIGTSQVKGGVQWKDIVKGLVKDVIEDVSSDHKELWTSCKRDGKSTGKLMREMREQCTQCVEEYKKTVED